MRLRIRAATLLVALCAAVTAEAQVQVTPPRTHDGWSSVRVAKWALLGAAVGFGSYALVQSSRAGDQFAQLQQLCQTTPAACQLQNGRYADPSAEALFQGARAADRLARVGIIGGQVTLLGSVGLFVYDLRNGRGPNDIPYPPSRALLGLGVRVAY
ncbi:MAG TPA: hypothetical protein VMM77_07185 [Gemmatimonadaceae bacterium]|nr:hypothetical protein [Gemmatimonadaceae bacterium]